MFIYNKSPETSTSTQSILNCFFRCRIDSKGTIEFYQIVYQVSCKQFCQKYKICCRICCEGIFLPLKLHVCCCSVNKFYLNGEIAGIEIKCGFELLVCFKGNWVKIHQYDAG